MSFDDFGQVMHKQSVRKKICLGPINTHASGSAQSMQVEKATVPLELPQNGSAPRE